MLEALYRAEGTRIFDEPGPGPRGELDRVETYRGTTVKMELAEKVRFEIAVSDDFVAPTIAACVTGPAQVRSAMGRSSWWRSNARSESGRARPIEPP